MKIKTFVLFTIFLLSALLERNIAAGENNLQENRTRPNNDPIAVGDYCGFRKESFPNSHVDVCLRSNRLPSLTINTFVPSTKKSAEGENDASLLESALRLLTFGVLVFESTEATEEEEERGVLANGQDSTIVEHDAPLRQRGENRGSTHEEVILEQVRTIEAHNNDSSDEGSDSAYLQEQTCAKIIADSRMSLMDNISSLPAHVTLQLHEKSITPEADSISHHIGQWSSDGIKITQVRSDDHSFSMISHEKSFDESTSSLVVSDPKEEMKRFVVAEKNLIHPETDMTSFQNKRSVHQTKKVSFDIPFSPKKEETSTSSPYRSISKRSQKIPSLDTPNKIEFSKCVKQFKGILRNMTQAIDVIPEGTDPSIPSAAIYAVVYPKARACLQTMLSTVGNDVALQDKETTIQLANAAIEVIQIAAKTVAPEQLEPISIKQWYDFRGHGIKGDDNIITNPNALKRPFNLPCIIVDYRTQQETLDIEAQMTAKIMKGCVQGPQEIRSMEAQIVAVTAEDAIQNLKEIKKVLKAADAEVGGALHQSQIKRASRAEWAASKKSTVMGAKRCLLRALSSSYEDFVAASVQVRSEDSQALQFSIECGNHLETIQSSTPITDPTEATRVAIADLLQITQLSLEAADNIIIMLLSRKISI